MAKTEDQHELKLPYYAKVSFILIGLFVLMSMLAICRSIVVPILFSLIISILLSTAVDFLVSIKVNRLLAISITLFIGAMIVIMFGMWVISQASLLIENWPVLMDKLDVLQENLVRWLNGHFGLTYSKANNWINSARADLMTLSSEKVGNALSAIMNGLVVIILIPIYIFLILYYQPLLVDFVHRVIGDGHANEVGVVLDQTRTILKAYFVGLLIELVILAILNSIGLLIIGIDYAILIGIAGAVLNLVPYLGGLIMLGLSMLMALLTKDDPSYALYAAIVFFIIQIIDNYFLLPRIVGSKVKINALVSIAVVIAGGAIWGVAGMFLAIPVTAIIKVIFDRIPALEPWGFLLGDTMPPMVRLKLRRRKK